MKIIIDVPEKLALDGFERPFTEEERNIFIKAIGNGTPLTQQQRTGRWILIHRNGTNVYACSECNNEPLLIGEDYPIFKLSDYCPYCGIKMEEVKNE